MNEATIIERIKVLSKSNLGTPLLILIMLIALVLPLHPFMLDILFTFNISLSLIIILTCVYITRPLEFSIFPTVILVTTLLRLTLNIASTRVVLLHGHEGPDAAGQVIHAFGEVVIGGNYTVGLVVFAILVIINFVVVTKGGGRISEVSARFTLDAMPGKQMSIDADLNAGVISQSEAKTRRAEITAEADFYGAMDGASKFVRGDAIAGLLILFINLIGGLAIGIADHGMPFSTAVQNYSLLTIGDGLVAQIPSLLLSSAAAIMVTRVNTQQDMTNQIIKQLLDNPRPLAISGIVLGILAIIPGMPHIVFFLLAMICGGGAYLINSRKQDSKKIINPENLKTEPEKKEKELDWGDVSSVDLVGLEIGYRVINLVGVNKDGQLVSRVRGVRKKLSQDLGFLIPAVHIKDNLDLPPNHYRITLMGVNYGESDVHPDMLLAINPGQSVGQLEGINTKDPTFGLPAVWINNNQREYAQGLGYTVVNAATVIATHLSQILQTNAAQLLGHEEVQQLLDRLSQRTPKLVEALTPPGGMSLSVIVKVLQKLLNSNIPITDMRTIAENIVEHSSKTQQPDELYSHVRVALKRLIIQQINGNKNEINIMTIDPNLEQILIQSQKMLEDQGLSGELGLNIEPDLAERLFNELKNSEHQFSALGLTPIMVVAPKIRNHLERFFKSSVDQLHVLSYQELPDDKHVKVIAVLGQQISGR